MREKRGAFGTDSVLGPSSGDYSMHSWEAQFVEVRVDPELGTILVSRMVGVFDCGRVLNPKTTHSQLIGGMTMGLGMALLEGAEADRRNGRIVHANLADYIVPVNSDVPDVKVDFVGEPDPYTNALGTKAVGELGITDVAAAIANAVFHATGRRFRELPIRLEHVIA